MLSDRQLLWESTDTSRGIILSDAIGWRPNMFMGLLLHTSVPNGAIFVSMNIIRDCDC